jgi:hypothetical protein
MWLNQQLSHLKEKMSDMAARARLGIEQTQPAGEFVSLTLSWPLKWSIKT